MYYKCNLKTFSLLSILLITSFTVSSQDKVNDLKLKIDQIERLIDSTDLYKGRSPRRAMPFIETADSICSTFKHEHLKYKILFTKAVVLRNSKDHQKALALFEEYIAFQEKENVQPNLSNGYKVAGDLYARENEFDKGESYLLNALEYYKASGPTDKYGNTLKGLGSLFRRKGDFVKSLKYYQEALDLLKGSKDIRNIANLNNSLGILYADMDDLVNAESHFLISLELNEKRKDGLKQFNALSNLASVSTNKNKVVDYLKRALDVSKKLKLPRYIANANFNLANEYMKSQDYKKALIHFHNINDITKDDGSNNMPEVKQQMAQLYGHLKKPKEAFSFLKQSIAELPQIKEPIKLADGYGSIAKTYSVLGDFKNAYAYNEKHKLLKDSLMNISKQEQISELETAYKVKEKNLEIESLGFKDKVNNLQIKRQRFAIGGLIFFLSLLSYLLYKMYLQKKKINQQNKEKELLLKEIHHRVKNNLQVISSLLGIQYRSIKDDAAKKAIQEGRTRVHSMALIHQDLYKKDNLAGIKMKSYLTNLSHDLFKTYNILENKIELTTDIEDITLDVESVIPIGLIINELITNALKYAFPDDREGKIKITFKEVNNTLSLSVIDNGVGIDKSHTKDDESSFGHTLIKAFKSKLDAELTIDSKDGTTVKMEIKKYKKC